MAEWHYVSGNQPSPHEPLPPERKTVLVWLEGSHLPFCGYVRYAAGDKDCPYFVVYHGNTDIGAEVRAWCDCLPDDGPNLPNAQMYARYQATGRGFPARLAGCSGGNESNA